MSEPMDVKKDGDIKAVSHVLTESDLYTQPTNSSPTKTEEHEGSMSAAPVYIDDEGLEHYTAPVETAAELSTEVIHVEDDPTLNPWTFRTWFLGMSCLLYYACLGVTNCL
jgi:hypothetical protein